MEGKNQLAKKILSMILIIVFVFPIITPLRSNATGLTVTLDTNDTQIKAGQKICVNIYATGDSIASLTCYPSFDKNIFNDISSSSLVVPSALKDQGNGSWKASYSSSNNKITVEENDGSYFTIPNGGLLFSINLVAKIDASTTTIKLKTVESDGENDYYSIAEVSGTIPKAAPVTYNITYNQNTADTVNNMPSAGQKIHGTSYTIPSTVPTRTGYTFAGWYTNSNGTGTSYQAGGSYTTDADATFYAKWTAKQATLTVNPNGGTWDGSSSAQTFTQNYNSTKTINNPTRTPNGHTVRFNTNGGTSTDSLQQVQTTVFTGWNKTGGGSLSSTTYTFGDSNGTLMAQYKGQAITLPNATKTGATLKGWYTSQTGGTPVGVAGASWTPSADTTLFAQWNELDYTLTVNPNGGTWKGGTAIQNVTGKYESTTTVSSPTAPNGYVVTLNNDGTTSTVTQTKTFTAWTLSGKGRIDGTTYTFGDGNGTITAQYTPNSVTLLTPTKTGYTFDGWYTASTGGNKVTSPYTPTNNVTLYARWTANKYTITFDGKGVAVTPSTKQVTYGQTYGTLPAPTKPGYTFNGWYNGGNKVQSTDTVDITGNTTLSAQWLGAEYTVTFDPDGGNVNPTNKKVNNEDQYGTLPTPTKTGYTFAGWYKDGTKIESTTKVETTTDITLKAKWTAIKSTLTVNPNGGIWDGSSSSQTFTQDYNTTKTINNPSKNVDGHRITFDGNGGTSQIVSITQTTTFTGWTAAGKGSFGGTTYTFGDGNGTLTANYIGDNITLPNATKTGATLKGWYTASTGGTLIGSAGDTWKPSVDATLYAQWNETNYTLTVDPNGGTWNGNTAQQTVTGTYNSTETITNPTAPNGYIVTLNNDGTTTQITQTKTFTGWTTSGKGSISGTTYTFGDGDGTITAQYKDDDVTLPTPTKTGYTFDGWYTESTGGNKVATPYKPTKDETVYARWTANKYKITFDGNGATGVPASKDVTYGEKYGELPTPTKDGFEFDGWYKEDGTKVTKDDIVNITEETKLTAGWLGAEYTVNFDADGGNTSVTSKKVKNGGKYGELPTPTKTGYTFVGWYDSNDNKVESTTTANISSDVTLKAKYEKDKYTVTFKNDDGNTLYTTVVQYEDKAEFSGKTPTSTKNTPGYEAKFKGWDNQTALDKVTGNTTVTATYELSPIKYKISYNNIKDSDNSQNPTEYTIEDTNITLKDLADKETSKFLGWYDKAVGGNKITSIDTSKLENIILYAQWEKDELYLKSEKYKIGENDIDNYEQGDIYLDKIEPNTTLKDFIANCDTNGDITVINSEGKELSDDDLVGTGMTMKVKRYDEEITLTLVVMGDLDGDGKVTAVDLSTMNQAILKTTKLENAEFKAADLDDNKKLTATDLSTINDTILGNITLTYKKQTIN